MLEKNKRGKNSVEIGDIMRILPLFLIILLIFPFFSFAEEEGGGFAGFFIKLWDEVYSFGDSLVKTIVNFFKKLYEKTRDFLVIEFEKRKPTLWKEFEKEKGEMKEDIEQRAPGVLGFLWQWLKKIIE